MWRATSISPSFSTSFSPSFSPSRSTSTTVFSPKPFHHKPRDPDLGDPDDRRGILLQLYPSIHTESLCQHPPTYSTKGNSLSLSLSPSPFVR